jgi:formamidopyrimidine-DNA glycosylase
MYNNNMPELPEVQTVVNGLNNFTKGLTISSVEYDWPKTIKNNIDEFLAIVKNSTIIQSERRGKAIIINLDNNYSLIFHLKMTGQIVLRSKKIDFGAGHPNDSFIHKLPDKTTRLNFHIKQGGNIFFNDVRKFGWVEAIPTANILKHKFIKSLGQEPLEMDLATFIKIISKKPHKNIKSFLLDQTMLAGIGNIYTDEALFLSQINPTKKIEDIPLKQQKKLFKNLIYLLNLSIENGGASSKNYIKIDGKSGSFLQFANVYGRKDQLCNKCKTTVIKRIKIAGRGTHYCPNCQK